MSDESREGRAAAFVSHLRGLADAEDRGALAALRRSLQSSSGMAMTACPHVVPWLRVESSEWEQKCFFLIAALFALHPEHEDSVSIGHAFRRINDETAEGRQGGDNESTRARFVALLDAHADDVAEHLRHAVSLARSKGVAIDWYRTLRDLLDWRHESRRVQRRLASEFWRESAVSRVLRSDSETAESETER